jgi:alginate O-acetyltransferase complex protein AlgI
MITFAPFPQTLPRERVRLDWLPLLLLTTAACVFTPHAPAWARMWLIALALFAGFKWWTWCRVVARDLRARGAMAIASATDAAFASESVARQSRATPNAARSLTYLLLWPGMNARTFLANEATQSWVARTTRCPGARSAQEVTPARTTASQWLWALAKTLLGATLLWICARLAGQGLLAGWIAMVGFIFLLHFGLFALLSLFWQSRGLDAPPLMKCPIAAQSLHEFWGRRWNAGFRDIVFALFFFPLARRFGTTAAALFTFVLSGLIHELVITVPAGAGYGLPTLYFALQGAGLMLERTAHVRVARTTRCPGARSAQEVAEKLRTVSVTSCVSTEVSVETPRQQVVGATPQCALFLSSLQPNRLFTLAVVTLPLAALFPPVFVLRVMVPFFQLIHAL